MSKNLILSSLLICTLNIWTLCGCNNPPPVKNDVNGELNYDFNTAVFYKNNNNLILESNRNCFDD